MTASKGPKESFQITEQHNGRIQVIYRDLVNGSDTEPTWISRGLMAKYHSQLQVISAKNGINVVRI